MKARILLVLTLLLLALPSHADNYALLIGIDEYEDKDKVTPLSSAARDAAELAKTLIEVGGYPKSNVRLLTSTSSALPTRKQIFTELSQLEKRVKPDDVVFFFFSGHGIEVNNVTYLIPWDVDAGDETRMASSSLSTVAIADIMSRLPAKALIMAFDMCRNAPLKADVGRGLKDNTFKVDQAKRLRLVLSEVASRTGSGPGAVITLFSCKPQERSWEWLGKRRGYFSYFLEKGLRGAAADTNGVVRAPGLIAYLERAVPAAVQTEQGQEQTPFSSRDGIGVDDVPLLSARSVAATRPSPLAPKPLSLPAPGSGPAPNKTGTPAAGNNGSAREPIAPVIGTAPTAGSGSGGGVARTISAEAMDANAAAAAATATSAAATETAAASAKAARNALVKAATARAVVSRLMAAKAAPKKIAAARTAATQAGAASKAALKTARADEAAARTAAADLAGAKTAANSAVAAFVGTLTPYQTILLGEYRAACDKAEQTLAATPKDAEAMCYKGIALVRMGRAVEARNLFTDVLDQTGVKPARAAALAKLGLGLALQRAAATAKHKEMAAALCLEAGKMGLKLKPNLDLIPAYTGVLRFYRERNDTKNAQVFLDEACARIGATSGEQAAAGWFELAACCQETGDIANARTFLERAKQQSPAINTLEAVSALDNRLRQPAPTGPDTGH